MFPALRTFNDKDVSKAEGRHEKEIDNDDDGGSIFAVSMYSKTDE